MFIWSAFAHLIALTSPGPDTAIVIRQVSIHGRVEGIKTAIGIGFGILVHCILAISGISLLILANDCLLYTSPSPRDDVISRMPSSA